MPIILLSGLVLLSSLFSPSVTHTLPVSQTQAVEQVAPLNMKAKGVYVADAKTQAPLVEYHKNDTWSIASLTKMMTALVFLEENPNLNSYITYKKEDFVGGATLHIPVGTKIRARDVLYTTLMSSANNSANALVHGTGLTRDEFIQKMNDKSKELGLKNTHFVEPTGLSPQNVSTPEEFTKIFAAAMDKPLIAKIMSTTHYEVRPLNYSRFAVGNTNKLLKQPQGFEVVGGKTGFTYGSDFNFASKLKKDDKEVLVVVFGDQTMDKAFENTKKLAEDALKE